MTCRWWRGVGATACLLVLAGCSDETGEPPPVTASGSVAASASVTTSGPVTASPSAAASSPSAPLPTAAGVGDRVTAAVDGGQLELVLERLEVATSCPGRAAPTQAPALGHFVILHLTVTFDGDGGFAPIGAEQFSLLTEQGVRQQASSTDASWACFEDDELLPAFVDDGTTVAGLVVLDSRFEHGRVQYGPADEWSWAY